MDSIFTSVKQEKNYRLIIDQIKSAIIHGKLKVGDQLPTERALVEQFKVSRSSVREALKGLEILGIVESRQGGGYYVVNDILPNMMNSLSLYFILDGSSLQELIQLRTSIELGSMRIVIQERTDEEIAVLGEHIALYQASETSEERQRHDLAFHTELVRLSHNSLYEYFLYSMQTIYERNVSFSNIVVEDKGMLDETIQMHVNLYEAIRTRDYQWATYEMNRHFDFTADDIKRQNEYFFRGIQNPWR